MSNLFEPGAAVTITRSFTAVGGTPIAVVMALTFQNPAGTEVPVTLGSVSIVGTTATASGTYTIPATNASAGLWQWRWVCSGDIIAVRSGSFVVDRSRVLDT